MDKYNLKRFLDAQKNDYATALSEIKAGIKRSHWIWYIFPQMAGLGFSSIYWFNRSIGLIPEIEKSRIAPRLNNIAMCYARLNQHVKAAAYMWLAYQFGNTSSRSEYDFLKTKVSAGMVSQIEQIFSIAQLNNFLRNNLSK